MPEREFAACSHPETGTSCRKTSDPAQLPYHCTLHNHRCGVQQDGTPRARMRSWLTATDMHPPAPPSMPLLFPTCPALSPPPRRRSPAAGSAAAGAPRDWDSDKQRESEREGERGREREREISAGGGAARITVGGEGSSHRGWGGGGGQRSEIELNSSSDVAALPCEAIAQLLI